MATIKERIHKTLISRFPDIHPKSEDTLTDDLGMASLDILEFVMDLEEEFQINISDKYFKDVKTVGDIEHLLENWQENVTDTAE